MKRTNIQIGTRILLNELKYRAKLANLSPDKSYKFSAPLDFKKPLDTLNRVEKGIKVGEYKNDWLAHNFEEEVKKMVDVYDYDKEGFLHIKVNPRMPKDLIYYLIGLGIDDYPRKIQFHYTGMEIKKRPEWEDFLDRYYPQFPHFPPLLHVSTPDTTPPKIRKGRVITHKNRLRDERLKALQVWEERMMRKPFKQIAIDLNVKSKKAKDKGTEYSEPACKKMFYKAYELLYGKKYNPADFEKPEIKKKYLKRTCETCNERASCKNLCPDVITFVEQDNKSYQREMTNIRIDNFHDEKEIPQPATEKGSKIKGAMKQY